MFDNMDMPLFSGTPMQARESQFDPKPVNTQLVIATCHVCLDTGKVVVNGYERFCTCERGEASTKARVVSDCRSLGGSTMASLTGLRKYDDVDAIQADFAEWVNDPERPMFTNWQQAWKAYSNDGTREFKSKEE